MADDRLYATYFEIVYPETDWSRRWQFIVLPRHPDQEYYHYFSRNQNHPKNAARWSGYRIVRPEDVMDLIGRLLEYEGRHLREPVVVQLSLAELDHYVGHSQVLRTPWKVLDRVKAVAPKLGWHL